MSQKGGGGMVFIRRQRLENSPATTENSPDKFRSFSFIIIFLLLYTNLLLLHFLIKTLGGGGVLERLGLLQKSTSKRGLIREGGLIERGLIESLR